MGLRGQKPQGKVKIKWSSDFAYAIGLIVTDGCLSSSGRHITFVSKDLEQIRNFMKCLKIKTKIGRSHSGYNESKAYRVQFGDILFYRFLEKIGLSQAKSKTIGSIVLPDKYFFDFLRGCFDGDGCSYSYWDSRWKSSFMFYIAFASASITFISWFQLAIARLSNLHGHISSHRKKNGKHNYFQLRYSKYEAIKLTKLMYCNDKCIKLSRKHLKIKKSLDIVRKHKRVVFVR